jgi:peptidoglycan/LPS O-acetylase OafA/YrhL
MEQLILCPLLLWLAWKLQLSLLTMALVITIITFALGGSEVIHRDTAAFYAPLMHFWELLAGAVIAHMAF